jgi:hypothetical protein
MTKIISIVGGMQPSAPTIGTATAGDTTASVAFTASSYIGKGTITYTATSSPGGLTATGASSPLTVTGLTNGTAYTFTVVGNTNYGVASVASAASNSITPAASGSYESIATVTLTSGTQASVTFSSIPETYTHLEIRFVANNNDTANSGLGNVRCSGFFNGDTNGGNYYNHWIDADGTGTSGQAENSAKWVGSATRNSMIAPGSSIATVLDYRNTNKYKTTRALWGWNNNDTTAGNDSSRFVSGLWLNTARITSITITPESGLFKAYSSFALYGIKGA